jgi:hypothetical protein
MSIDQEALSRSRALKTFEAGWGGFRGEARLHAKVAGGSLWNQTTRQACASEVDGVAVFGDRLVVLALSFQDIAQTINKFINS